ncbi:MAG: hypothetical protein FWD76_03655 [Firmicutes bacterium]|nr:hypothetical protein [Bacillota bacterium]
MTKVVLVYIAMVWAGVCVLAYMFAWIGDWIASAWLLGFSWVVWVPYSFFARDAKDKIKMRDRLWWGIILLVTLGLLVWIQAFAENLSKKCAVIIMVQMVVSVVLGLIFRACSRCVQKDSGAETSQKAEE